MSDEDIRDLLTLISKDYIETILIGIEEYEKDFPYTIACTSFISELKRKNIVVNIYSAFDNSILDMVYRETIIYLAR